MTAQNWIRSVGINSKQLLRLPRISSSRHLFLKDFIFSLQLMQAISLTVPCYAKLLPYLFRPYSTGEVGLHVCVPTCEALWPLGCNETGFNNFAGVHLSYYGSQECIRNMAPRTPSQRQLRCNGVFWKLDVPQYWIIRMMVPEIDQSNPLDRLVEKKPR